MLPSVIRYPEELPICARRGDILAAMRAHPVVIVAGETGSGKTTQLPKLCLELEAEQEAAAGASARPGRGPTRQRVIGCTQPRRVAALSVSRRVAEELGVSWGREVGCKIRFADDTGRDTRIKFMTDGILLAEVQSDPLLRAYSTLILDEAHERSLNIDFLLGYLKELLRRRPVGDLRVVITSATIDTAAFSAAFDKAPVVEVSGRLYPVEIRYRPVGSASLEEELEDETHVEAAARAAEDALLETDSGDVLVFMPTERDIRETQQELERRLGRGTEVLTLFGRMAAGEQTRIFSPGAARRVIVATNLAETSLTIPRVRCVIDTGLARISRYNPRTRTKRLPVEAISQSSANQRAGRAGRVREGVCIRLYDEEDFNKRPRFTQPEIQRANLAEVILRLKAFRLGEIETFPFLNPPLPASIRAGYELLHELGALDDAHALTPLGRELASLPVDPTLGRMLLQARREGALAEVLVIAAGLSVPDPRERPENEKEAAAAAHRALADPESDFLTLLRIWRAMPENPSRNALRRFAQSNYLSQTRLREWRDIVQQLTEAVNVPRGGPPAPAADYDRIHRAILTGLIGQIGQRKERNTYTATGQRLVTVFPGSGLYRRTEKRPKVGPAAEEREKNAQPPWIVAGEIVQTSQLFARTIARITPEWVAELGAHLCRFSYTDPHWSEKAERVLAWERVLLSGLEVVRRRVDFGKVDPVKATELFIRGALVAGEAAITPRFFQENRTLRERVESALTRVRDRRVGDLDEAFYRFYAARIEGVSSIHDLNKLVGARIAAEPDFLIAAESDLLPPEAAEFDRAAFPEQVAIHNTALPLTYAYAPGEERDGVTVRVPLPAVGAMSGAQVQWLVPGLRAELVGTLLRALPKTIRRTLQPLEAKGREVAAEFEPGRDRTGQGEFLPALAAYLSKRYGVTVRAEDWPADSLPAHLRPRIEVVDRDNKPLASGRDLRVLQADLEKTDLRSDAWDRAARRWEKPAVKTWSFGDLPESVVVEEIGGVPLVAFAGLAGREGEVDVRLFRRRADAEAASRGGVRRLAERALERDLAWVRKEIGALLAKGGLAAAGPGRKADFRAALGDWPVAGKGEAAGPAKPGGDALAEATFAHVAGAALLLEPVFPLTSARFQALIERARRELPLSARQTGEAVARVREARRKIASAGRSYPGMGEDLERLAGDNFPARTPPGQLAHLARYLRAIEVRAERAALQPAKDVEKARALAPFVGWETRVAPEQREAFRWLLEEFRVSIFAQELGTAQPASAQRLKSLAGW